MIYHRWSGLGNHRYQVGFSGDAIITWKSLDFQPYFNHTASNVLYGYWSHDLGGHMGGIDRVDPEMYTRWMQFGAMSPIMRTHSTKNIKLKKEPWVFDYDITLVLRNTVRQRYTMAPYIYSMARRAYDDAIALCRPMYYDYPKAQEAYDLEATDSVDGQTVAELWRAVKDTGVGYQIKKAPGKDGKLRDKKFEGYKNGDDSEYEVERVPISGVRGMLLNPNAPAAAAQFMLADMWRRQQKALSDMRKSDE